MDKTFINIYHNAEGLAANKKLSVLDVIWKISGGEWKPLIENYRLEQDKKKREELKKLLPCVTFSGLCNGTRSDENLSAYTNLIVIDVDKISRAELSIIKSKLKTDNYVQFFFESPSFGLKIVLKVNSGKEHHKSHAFRQIQEYFSERHNIAIDRSGSNLTRLCFMSYDENMYFNDAADVFPVDTSIDYDKIDAENFFSSVQNNPNIVMVNDGQYIFETCIEWVKKSKVGGYHKGNRNNFVFALSCHLNRAGVNPMQTVNLIMGRYSSMGLSEIKTTVMSAYKHNNQEFGSKPIFKKKTNQDNFF